MSDIVERLRAFQPADETTYGAAWLIADAADEIERLRHEVEFYRTKVEEYQGSWTDGGEP